MPIEWIFYSQAAVFSIAWTMVCCIEESRTLEMANWSWWFISNIIAVVIGKNIGNQTILSEMGAFFERIKFDWNRFFAVYTVAANKNTGIAFMQWMYRLVFKM